MQDLNKLQTFVQVAARGSFTMAARELRVSPSAVSKQVQQLEKALSVSLLNRSTRGVSLTEAGRAFYQRCQEALTALDDAVNHAQTLHAGSAGTLRVHVVSGFAQRELSPLMVKFMREHPQISVEMSTSTPAKSLVEAGADVVVSGKTLPDPGAVWHELGVIEYVTCAAPDYLAHRGTPKRPEDLRDHNCLLHTVFTPREWPFRSGSRIKLVRVAGTFKSDNSEVLAELALGGVGVVRVPLYVVREEIKAGRLISLLEGLATSRQIMRVYYPSHANLPEKTKIFLHFLEASFKPRKSVDRSLGKNSCAVGTGCKAAS
jgi:DNA-binding transcriptional LysR family regulator